MDLATAKDILSKAVKSELRDHAFGDCEILWWTPGQRPGKTVATGYFSGTTREVVLCKDAATFKDAEADELRVCFVSEWIDRNDTTGPDEFVVGQIMPGLTKEGVFSELTGE